MSGDGFASWDCCTCGVHERANPQSQVACVHSPPLLHPPSLLLSASTPGNEKAPLSLRKRATRPRSSPCSRLARLPTATATAWTCGPRSTMPHGTTTSTQPRCSWRTTPTCTLAARTSEPREPRRRSQGALGARLRRARSHRVPGHHVLFCGRIRRQRRRSPGSLGAGLLVHGADVHARNKDGCTPLAEAELFDSREMKALLQQHGAK